MLVGMRGIGLLAVVAVGISIVAGGVLALVFRSGGSGPASRFRASPQELAFVGPKIPVVDTLAARLAPTCASRRGRPDSSAPASPITTWPETLLFRAECMYESPPGSGNATGGGFTSHGVAPPLSGGWDAFGPRGYRIGSCGITGREDCVGFSVFQTDPSLVQIDAFRRFPTNDGWVHVEVLLRRGP